MSCYSKHSKPRKSVADDRIQVGWEVRSVSEALIVDSERGCGPTSFSQCECMVIRNVSTELRYLKIGTGPVVLIQLCMRAESDTERRGSVGAVVLTLLSSRLSDVLHDILDGVRRRNLLCRRRRVDLLRELRLSRTRLDLGLDHWLSFRRDRSGRHGQRGDRDALFGSSCRDDALLSIANLRRRVLGPGVQA